MIKREIRIIKMLIRIMDPLWYLTITLGAVQCIRPHPGYTEPPMPPRGPATPGNTTRHATLGSRRKTEKKSLHPPGFCVDIQLLPRLSASSQAAFGGEAEGL